MDSALKKQVLRQFTYGLYIMTAAADNAVAASTVTWLSQASFKPPRIMAAVRIDGGVHALVEQSGAFALHIVGQDQQDLAATFFKPAVVGDDRTLSGYAYEPGPVTGAPLMLDLPAWLEAQVIETMTGGDHTIFVADIVNVGLRDPELPPLTLRDTPWRYGR